MWELKASHNTYCLQVSRDYQPLDLCFLLHNARGGWVLGLSCWQWHRSIYERKGRGAREGQRGLKDAGQVPTVHVAMSTLLTVWCDDSRRSHVMILPVLHNPIGLSQDNSQQQSSFEGTWLVLRTVKIT